eukprot:SAG31_NODE_416_length_15934_cov_7.384970_10_plen_289_part_00
MRALDFAEQEAAERVKQLDFPKKTMLPMSKNSEKVRKERSTMLQRWLNAALKELGKTTELCRFLGLNPEFIGITIVKEKNISEYKDLYDTTPLGRRKGLCAGQLPSKVILGIDDTGAQLFDGATRQPIAGEGYPYHLIRSWSWHQPADAAWHVVLTFGDDQKGYRLELGTQKGKEICAKMREYATLLAVNLRKESLEQQDTDVLQRKLDEMEERLRRLEAAEGAKHPSSCDVYCYFCLSGLPSLPIHMNTTPLWSVRGKRLQEAHSTCSGNPGCERGSSEAWEGLKGA